MNPKIFPPRNCRSHRNMLTYIRRGIKEIDFGTHRARFSIDHYDFFELFKIFNLNKPPQNNKKGSNYHKRFKGKFRGQNVTMLAFRKFPELPAYMVHIDDTDYDIIKDIDRILGENASLSQIEYKLDFKCKDNIYAGIVFANFLRHLYFKRKKETSIAGGNFIGLDVERHENCVFHIWNDEEFKRTYLTIYERGPDHLKKWDPFKKKHYWFHEDVDRVRFEYKVEKRKDKKAVNLYSLKEFLKDPGFYRVMMPLINFRVFTSHSVISDPYEDNFTVEDQDGHPEIFQQEYLAENAGASRASNNIEKPKGFDWLLNMVSNALLETERAWKKKASGKQKRTRSP